MSEVNEQSARNRRHFLKIVGGGATGAAASLSGCLSSGGGSENGTTTDGSDKTGPTSDSGESTKGFPSGKVQMIVPWAAGGGTDRTARKLASLAEKNSDASYFVSNVTGGSGSAGFRRVANAKPDGTTVGVLTVEVCTISHLGISDTRPKAFAPIMQYNFDPASLTVHQDAPYDTIEGFVEHAKQKGGKMKISNSGIGAIWHLSAALFTQRAGISNSVKHIGYDGGSPAAKAVVSGEVDATTASAAEVAPLVKDGPLKVLGVMGEEQVNILPDVPTFREKGYKVTIGAWRGLGAPAGTPQKKVKALHDVYKSVYDSQAFKDFMKNNGFGMVYRSPDKYGQFMQQEYQQFNKLIDKLNIKS